MIERREGRALAVVGHVIAAEITDHVDAGEACQQRAVADLPAQPLLGAVGDGVAVKADDMDRARLDALSCQQGGDRIAMGARHRLGDAIDVAGPAEAIAQAGAQAVVIGNGEPTAGLDQGFAVGLDERRVDAVERRAAHQSQRQPYVAHRSVFRHMTQVVW